MQNKKYRFDYQIHTDLTEISEVDKTLIQRARVAAQNAYAPYSNFKVGAAILLENGEIFSGNNQENASYPVGICAERTLISYVHANFPDHKKIKLAISVPNSENIISPCGLCRQTLLEYEKIQNLSIQILLHNSQDMVLIIDSVSHLLPLHFDHESLK